MCPEVHSAAQQGTQGSKVQVPVSPAGAFPVRRGGSLELQELPAASSVSVSCLPGCRADKPFSEQAERVACATPCLGFAGHPAGAGRK